MRKTMFVAVPIIIAILTLLVIEGVASIANWKNADRSLVYGIYAAMRGSQARTDPRPPGLPMASRDEIEALIPDMVAAGVGMGNVPYSELVTDRAAINAVGVDGCLAPKPGIDKITTYIRSGDYDRYDPPSLFHDRQASLSAALQGFIDAYAVRKARFTSNERGERTTLPKVLSARKVLVAGDSVAVGSMIDDAETIASHMQRRTQTAQFVNLGVNGASAEDIVCRLSKSGERYKGQIVGLIYVYCENDFDSGRPYGTPEAVIAWLKAFAEENRIPSVTVVYAPYIYNIVPSITRFAGSRGALHGVYGEEAARLRSEVEAAGFGYIDIGEIAQAEARRQGTDFAALSLFVDHVHLSNLGVTLLANALPGF